MAVLHASRAVLHVLTANDAAAQSAALAHALSRTTTTHTCEQVAFVGAPAHDPAAVASSLGLLRQRIDEALAEGEARAAARAQARLVATQTRAALAAAHQEQAPHRRQVLEDKLRAQMQREDDLYRQLAAPQ